MAIKKNNYTTVGLYCNKEQDGWEGVWPLNFSIYNKHGEKFGVIMVDEFIFRGDHNENNRENPEMSEMPPG